MYQEFILTLLIIFIIYTLYTKDNTKYFTADNGKKYKIVYDDNSLKKANMLAELDSKVTKLVNYVNSNNLPNVEDSSRLYERFNKIEIKEIPSGQKGAGFTINKGHINLCVINIKTGKLNDIQDVMFVLLHELAHTMSVSYGHGEEFKKNFDILVKTAVKEQLWEPKDYSKQNTDICGVTVTNGNCDNGSCGTSELDYFFKETLLEYK